MSARHDIDELLKNNLGQLEQTPPPEAWGSIQHGLSNMTPAGAEGAAKTIASGVKSASILTKIVVAVVSSAVVAGTYITYKHYGQEKKADVIATSSSQTLTVEEPLTTKQDEKPMTKENIRTSDEPIIASEKKQSTVILTAAKGKETTEDLTVAAPITKPTNETEGSSQNIAPASLAPTTDKPQASSDPITKNSPGSKPNAQQVPAKPKPKHNFGNVESDKQTGSSDAYVYEPKPNIGNVLTPNGDGENDRFRIEIDNEIVYELIIYDKDNKKVFESVSKDNTWDGTYNNSGIPCDAGVFHYIFTYQYANGKPHAIPGQILLRKN